MRTRHVDSTNPGRSNQFMLGYRYWKPRGRKGLLSFLACRYISTYDALYNLFLFLPCLHFSVVQCFSHRWAWWFIGRFAAYCPEVRGFESRPSIHVGTLGKSFTLAVECDA